VGGLLFLWASIMTAAPAQARERLAVLIAVDGDPGLADNLTEVVISRLAQARDRELVGLRELRGRLAGILNGDSLDACLARPTCLAGVGTAAGAGRAVVGSLRRGEHAFAVRLAMLDFRTGAARAEVIRTLPAEMSPLIFGMRQAVDDLVRADLVAASEQRIDRPAPYIARIPLPNSEARRSSADLIREGDPRPVMRSPAFTAVTYGLAAVAIVTFSAAAVTGTLATASPVGRDRAAIQNDVERRKDYATLANGLYAAGAVLVAATAGMVIWRWR
jgi:hypothetical protein